MICGNDENLRKIGMELTKDQRQKNRLLQPRLVIQQLSEIVFASPWHVNNILLDCGEFYRDLSERSRTFLASVKASIFSLKLKVSQPRKKTTP